MYMYIYIHMYIYIYIYIYTYAHICACYPPPKHLFLKFIRIHVIFPRALLTMSFTFTTQQAINHKKPSQMQTIILGVA